MNPKIELVDDSEGRTIAMFRCPGCRSHHWVWVVGGKAGQQWEWNKSVEAPTFSPSVLVTYSGRDADTHSGLPSICHSFVREGRIEFLSDCRPRWRVTNDDDDSQPPGSGCRRICVTDGKTDIRCYEADVAAKLAAHLNATRFTLK